VKVLLFVCGFAILLCLAVVVVAILVDRSRRDGDGRKW
jgi:hypothetical protein